MCCTAVLIQRRTCGVPWPISCLINCKKLCKVGVDPHKGVAGAGRPSSLLVVARFLIYFLSKTDLPINDRCFTIEDSRASLYT